MVNYKNGKIYEIWNKVDENIYVGSTCQKFLCDRMSDHRRKFRERALNEDYKCGSKLYNLMKEHGVKNFYIRLIELCPCDTKEQLIEREAFFIKQQGTLNMITPNRTKEQWVAENMDKIKSYKQQWHLENKERINAKGKLNYQMNKDAYKARNKARYEANREEILEKQALYRKKTSESKKEYLKEYRENKKLQKPPT